jgi:hypothetical protein
MLPTPRNRFPWLLLLLACGAGCLAITTQSFWIDETQTALKAAAPSVHSWWQRLYAEHDSNLQVPFYMVYVWLWARIFPVSELSLRAANIPWFFLGFYAIAHFLRRRPGLRDAALLLYAIHPFVWYYLNEARPYVMQLSGALLVCGALFKALDEPEGPLDRAWWWQYGVGIAILCGSNLLAIPWALSITSLLLYHEPFQRSLWRAGRPVLLVFGPVLACMAVYYAWTIREGIGPTLYGAISLKSIPFVLYEQFGFAGYGPGRDTMRTGEWSLFFPYIPGFCLLAIPLLYALARSAAARFGLPRGRFLPVLLAALLPAALVFVLGFAKHFRVLGRHLMPLFPFVIGAFAFAICHLWSGRRLLDRAAVVLMVAALAVSALECRFADRHRKDDNRDAAAISRAALAQGDDVWWAADRDSARYYGLPLSAQLHAGSALLLWRPQSLAQFEEPALIVLSKPDLFDPNGTIRQYIREHGYVETQSLPAFTFWMKKAGG